MSKSAREEKRSLFFYVRVTMLSLYLNITGIVALLIILVTLAIQQGQDIIIQVGEYGAPFGFSFFCILLWAFLNWYTARLLTYEKRNRNRLIPPEFHKHIPRLIAFHCFVIVQAAIYALPTFQNSVIPGEDTPDTNYYHLHGIGTLLFYVMHGFIYYLLINIIENKTKVKRPLKIISLLVLVAVNIGMFLYYLLTHWHHDEWQRHVFRLPWFALLLFVSELAAVVFFILRRRRINDFNRQKNIVTGNGLEIGAGQKMFAHGLYIRSKYRAAERKSQLQFAYVAVFAVLVFIVAVRSVSLSNYFGPLAILLLGLGVLVFFLNLVSFLSIRAGLNLHIFAWILAIVFGLVQKPYNVKSFDTGNKQVFANQPSIKEHLIRWAEQRRSLLDSCGDHNFEAFIILSNGGGSLSGNWTSSILAKMQDQSWTPDSTNTFADHLLCMAGASGGTIGNIAFYSLLKEEREGRLPAGQLYAHTKAFFSTDFLSNTIGHLLGPDFFSHLFFCNLSGRDRARALEETMLYSDRDTLTGSLLAQKLEDAFDYSGKMPALFINSTRVDNGMPGEISSVQLPDSTQRINMLELMDRIDTARGWKPQTMQLVTAGVLSSRFPYMSPAGKLKPYYFVDGGYFDNSGAGIVLEYLQNIAEILVKDPDPRLDFFRKKLHFTVIQISNGFIKKAESPKEVHPLVNDLATPILTLAGMQNSSTKIGDGILRGFLHRYDQGAGDSAYIKFNLFDSTDKVDNYPMSWVISDYNLERMKRRADRLMMYEYYVIRERLGRVYKGRGF